MKRRLSQCGVGSPVPLPLSLQTSLPDTKVISKRNKSRRNWLLRHAKLTEEIKLEFSGRDQDGRHAYTLLPKLDLLWFDLGLSEALSPHTHLCHPKISAPPADCLGLGFRPYVSSCPVSVGQSIFCSVCLLEV